jgi:tRNA(adenine34) deaminase
MRQALLALETMHGEEGEARAVAHTASGAGTPPQHPRTLRRDVPVAAIVLDTSGVAVATTTNVKERALDPTGHAEAVAIREAAQKLQTTSLQGCTLITTLEPCIMCAGAILLAHIDTVVFGAWDEKFGASGSVWDLLRDPRAPHHPQVFGGLLADECSLPPRGFFRSIRTTSGP